MNALIILTETQLYYTAVIWAVMMATIVFFKTYNILDKEEIGLKLLWFKEKFTNMNSNREENKKVKSKEKYVFHFIIRTTNYHNHHEEVSADNRETTLKYNDKEYKTNIDKCFKHEIGLIDSWMKGTNLIYYAIFDDERSEQIIRHPDYRISSQLILKVREYKGLKGMDKEFEKMGAATNIPWWVYVVILIVAISAMVIYLNQIGFFSKFLEALANADKVKK